MKIFSYIPTALSALALLSPIPPAASAGQCDTCHGTQVKKWIGSAHANTQIDVATELSLSHPGEDPFSVIQGEDCIACHGPTAVMANGGMSEGQALGYFFTTTNGFFCDTTAATNTTAWPHVACTSCHSVSTNHPDVPGGLALFNSQTAQYVHPARASELCGQCHGTLHFWDTDHQVYDAWLSSKHANTQADVADELSKSHPGETPQEVTHGENCVACHAPTAVVTTGGDEATALDYFFSSTGGLFTTNTAPAHAEEWPGVGCSTCHDPHDPGKLSYFNSSTLEYEVMTNSAQLCGQCHGNLRFPDTDHLSFNILQGTGGKGLPDQQLMAGVTCTDCHMHRSQVDGSNSRMLGGHTWAISVPETDGQSTVSCILCHTNADPNSVNLIIGGWQSDFQQLDATVSANVAKVTTAMQNCQNSNLQVILADAQYNLAYAESDESGGFHNHPYLMALLKDANQKVLSIPILNAARHAGQVVISWTGPGTLQSAKSINGPWSDVTGATNPLMVNSVSGAQQVYYRLRP
jgi:Cytochrome c552/Cytochrome c554 and c-prime/Doubled CXXCH motif (Paired_CXXCH_1)